MVNNMYTYLILSIIITHTYYTIACFVYYFCVQFNMYSLFFFRYMDETMSPSGQPMAFAVGSASSSIGLYDIYDDGNTK